MYSHIIILPGIFPARTAQTRHEGDCASCPPSFRCYAVAGESRSVVALARGGGTMEIVDGHAAQRYPCVNRRRKTGDQALDRTSTGRCAETATVSTTIVVRDGWRDDERDYWRRSCSWASSCAR